MYDSICIEFYPKIKQTDFLPFTRQKHFTIAREKTNQVINNILLTTTNTQT